MCSESDPVENARTVRDRFQKVYNINSELDDPGSSHPEALSQIEHSLRNGPPHKWAKSLTLDEMR